MNSGLKYGWIFLLLAMAGDLLISLALPLFYKGYSVAKMSISALGNLVPLLVAILFFKGRDNGSGVFSIISFVVGLAFFVLFVMSDKSEFSKTIISCEGLWQRLNLLFMYLPLAFLTVKMLKNQ